MIRAFVIEETKRWEYDVPGPQTVWQGLLGNLGVHGRIVAVYPVDDAGILVADPDRPALEIQISEDGGESWTRLCTGSEWDAVWRFAMHDRIDGMVADGEIRKPVLLSELRRAI